MKLTNILLIILICIIAFQKLPVKKKETVSKEPKITIGRKTTSITPKVLNKNSTKHSSTFRNYLDTDGRSTQGISHNIRIGKEYYISGGITSRESSYGQRDISGEVSITKYW